MRTQFYQSLPFFTNFSEIFEERHFQRVPEDWWMVLTDVVGSTKAIEEGRYKDVNSAGSVPAMAISNIFGHMDFPFIFGGDGMTCLVPGEQVETIRSVLAGTGLVVRQAFNLDLRLCLIPVQAIYAQKADLKVAKWKVSEHYFQAIIEGHGIDLAERIMKTPGNPYELDPLKVKPSEPDLSGYTCRWQDFPSHKQETIALIVKFRLRDRTYFKDFLHFIDSTFGKPEDHHPLQLQKTKFRFSTRALGAETRVFTGKDSGPRAFFYRQWIRIQILGIKFFSFFHIKVLWGKTKDLSRVKEENISSSDYKKYDNTLKMVLAVTRDQRERLSRFLHDQASKGALFYGLHITDRAMLTCLLQIKTGEEVHFVDAADGGYAYAARDLKKQIQEAL